MRPAFTRGPGLRVVAFAYAMGAILRPHARGKKVADPEGDLLGGPRRKA